MKPTISICGTARCTLMEDSTRAKQAVLDAIDAMHHPNGRDYQGDAAGLAAAIKASEDFAKAAREYVRFLEEVQCAADI